MRLAVVLNILSALFNIFSFSLIVPILNMLFKVDDTVYAFIPWESDTPFRQKLLGNVYYYVSQWIQTMGASRTLLLLGLFLAVATLLKTACYFGASASMVPIRTGVVRDLRMQLYDKILSLQPGFFTRERRGDVVARISGDVSEVESSLMNALDMLIKNPILIIIYGAALVYISWQLTLFVIVVVPALAWLMGAIGKKLKRDSRQAQELWSDTMSQVEETLDGHRVVKAYMAEDSLRGRFSRVTADMRRSVSNVLVRQSLAHPVSELLGTLLIMAVLWFGGTLILSDRASIDAPTFIFYLAVLYSLINPIKEFSRASYGIPKGMASMDRISAILDTDSEIQQAGATVPLKGLGEGIRFEGVHFAYEDGAEVLSGIDALIPSGKTVAIVGESGAGKSTMTDLLLRFYDTTSGRITVGGEDIRNLSLKDLRGLYGYVGQEAVLFNDTIYENIAFGAPDATPESVTKAAMAAGAHAFIMEKEKGYDTVAGNRGSKLSGGQKQRIAIARAILRDPQVLILDEATASLDAESEKAVQDALWSLRRGRTTIVIAHRLATVRDADLILVVGDGRIIERGTHEELLAIGGYYKKLNDMQSL